MLSVEAPQVCLHSHSQRLHQTPTKSKKPPSKRTLISNKQISPSTNTTTKRLKMTLTIKVMMHSKTRTKKVQHRLLILTSLHLSYLSK